MRDASDGPVITVVGWVGENKGEVFGLDVQNEQVEHVLMTDEGMAEIFGSLLGLSS